MGRVCAERKSCRWFYNQQSMLEADFCLPCTDLANQSIYYLQNNQDIWRGKCHLLYPPDLVASASSTSRTTTSSRKRSIDDTEPSFARPKRTRKVTDHFVPAPSNGAKMEIGFNKTNTGIQKPWSRLNKKSDFLHRIRHNEDPAIDRAICQRFASAADKENKDVAITLPKGGKSKRAMSQLGTTMGLVFNGMVKKISSKAGLATPNRVRATAFDYSIKQQAILLTTPVVPPSASKYLYILTVSIKSLYSSNSANCFILQLQQPRTVCRDAARVDGSHFPPRNDEYPFHWSHRHAWLPVTSGWLTISSLLCKRLAWNKLLQWCQLCNQGGLPRQLERCPMFCVVQS
jgi:hypothetical protein